MENKAVNKSNLDEDLDDHGSECVICMSETRDTLILPCRHLCLCNSCADSLRYQANNCPICRAPFRALLQIRAVQKGVNSSILQQSTPAEPVCDQHIPAGYIPVSLIKALNGPPQYVSRTRDITDSVTGNIAGDPVNHKATSPHKSSSQRRSKNKKHAASVFSASNTESSNNTSEASNMVAAKNNQNQTLSTAEISSAEDNNSASTAKKIPKSDENEKSDQFNARHSQDKLEIVNERSSLKVPKGNKRQSNLSINNTHAQSGADDDSENEKLSPLLSPLTNKNQSLSTKLAKALTTEGVEESSMIDDVDSSEETENDKVYGTLKQHKRPALTNTEASVVDNQTNPTVISADADSDYYTPEDTQNSILSPLCPDKAKIAGEKLGGYPSSSSNVTFKGANNLAMKQLHKKSTSVGNIVGPVGGSPSELKGNISSLPDMLDGPIGSGAVGNSASTRSSSDSYSSSSSTKQLLSSNPPVTAANIIVDDKTSLQNAVNV